MSKSDNQGSGDINVTPTEGANPNENQLLEPPTQINSDKTNSSVITTFSWINGAWTQMPHVRLFRIHRKGILCFALFIICLSTGIQFLSYEAVSTENINFYEQNKKHCNELYEQEAIDVVYTWVNGSEKQFQKDLKFYASKYDKTQVPEGSYNPERFNDKEELKYSLRSLEKHMPWVRHVFIVTNGQIPSWLDLDYDKVSIVTHQEIFPEGDFLPTFSSPAIEANLHRIPGLSQKFIYFNDDIFLNDDVYKEDFYTQSKGFKIYGAWNIHNCAANCDWEKLNNSECDEFCYNKECNWDYHDCDTYKYKRLNFSKLNPFSLPVPRAKEEYLPSNLEKPTENLTNTIETKENQNRSLKDTNFVDFAKSNDASVDLSERIKLYNEKKMQEAKSNKKVKSFMYGQRIYIMKQKKPQNETSKKPKTKDLYSASLTFTQKLISQKFGFIRRVVIAHAPIMIDKSIMQTVVEEFPEEFYNTMRHRFRQEDNLQISFLYSHYLSNKMLEKSMEEIFNEYDTDKSGTWSDREIHTLIARISVLPLSFESVVAFQNLLNNCSSLLSDKEIQEEIRLHPIKLQYERYVDSTLNLVTKKMVVNCPKLSTLLRKYHEICKRNAYNHRVVGSNKDVSFNMLISQPVVIMDLLNNIRKSKRKFICLNDDLDRSQEMNEENEVLINLLHDFFLSMFPSPSKFELPTTYRNRFQRVEQLRHWKRWRWTDAFFVSLAFAFLSVLFLAAALIVMRLSYCFVIRCRKR